MSDDRHPCKWRQIIGDEDCTKAGLDPDSYVPLNREHADWKKWDESRETA